MKKLMAVGVLLAAIGAAIAGDRAATQTQLIQRLNGSAQTLGVARSADGGAFSTCTNTTSAFDAGFGDLLVFTCSEPAYVKPGTCATVATTSDRPVPGSTETVTMLTDSEMALAFLQQDGGLGLGCYVGHLR